MLSNRVDKLYAEFNNISMDEINKLWSNIGANYVPSVSYKIKHARFDGTELFENIPNILGRNR